MIWGAISKGFRSKLIVIHGSVDTKKYEEVLHESRIFEEADLKYGINNWWDQHDGASAHFSKKMQKFIRVEQTFYGVGLQTHQALIP